LIDSSNPLSKSTVQIDTALTVIRAPEEKKFHLDVAFRQGD